MGIATPPPLQSLTKYNSKPPIQKNPNSTIPMSQDYHHQQGIFNFPNGFERAQQEQQQQQHVMQQIPSRDKLRVQGFEPPPPLVAVGEEEIGGLPGYETAGMLSEMFNFPPGPATATEFLDGRTQISPPPPTEFRNTRPLSAGEWYGNRHPHQPHHQIPNADSAAAMHLFLINPQQPRSPSPSPQENSSTLHMLLPNPSPTSALQSFHNPIGGGGGGGGHFGQFTWVPDQRGHEGGQGLSLSLSSLEAVKAEDQLRMGDGGGGGMLFFNQGGGGAGAGGSISGSQYPNRISSGIHQNNYHQIHQVGFGNSSSMGLGGGVNVSRNSKYAKAAQELLEEFCSVGRGQFKKNKFGKHNNSNSNPNNPGGRGGSGGGGGQSSSKDVLPPLSATDRVEHQRRKVKLLSMLDEVERRYNHYCEQMQMVVNSFDLVMGFGSAVPYTALAQKAMSRHFRCLKDTISAQLKHSCELLGEKDAGTSGVTKGETPRLKLLEQSLRQQRAFHQMGGMMMDQEAWRPQRGLPERSVNILRAWLFEHFLHPYPSDADKHLLSRQTGLSRNQVSNWFINARVRLWKPMVEEMYQKESKEDQEEEDRSIEEEEREEEERERNQNTSGPIAQKPMPSATTTSATATPTVTAAALENDPSLIAINRQCFSENQAKQPAINNHPSSSSSSSSTMSTHFMPTSTPATAAAMQSLPSHHEFRHHGSMVGGAEYVTAAASGNDDVGPTLIRFGTTGGDVSLTLGLRHAGNMQEKSTPFSLRDFGAC